MKRKMSRKKSQLAYVLNKDPEFDKSQKVIADFLDVSQGTISNAINSVEVELTIKNLKSELGQAKKLLIENGIERKQLKNSFFDENIIDADYTEITID